MNPGTSDGPQPLHIGIDFDGTFSADPELWRAFIAHAQINGHHCYIVTARRDTDENREDIGPHVTGLPRYRHIFTEMQAKRHYCESKSIRIDIWVDDELRWRMDLRLTIGGQWPIVIDRAPLSTEHRDDVTETLRGSQLQSCLGW